MSETHTKIKSEIIVAMKAKDSNKLLALRSLDSTIKNIAIANGHREGPTEDDAIQGLSQAVKRGTDSADQFRAAGREDLLETELFQVQVARSFLPQQMEYDDLKNSLLCDIQDYLAINGSATQKDFGKIMNIVIPKYKGKAESKDIQLILKEVLV